MTPVRCGRLDRHEPHEWTRAAHINACWREPARTYWCSGFVVIEGGARRGVAA